MPQRIRGFLALFMKRHFPRTASPQNGVTPPPFTQLSRFAGHREPGHVADLHGALPEPMTSVSAAPSTPDRARRANLSAMPRHAVSCRAGPMNPKIPQLETAFDAPGFADVRTIAKVAP
jgi:hypothetical protein